MIYQLQSKPLGSDVTWTDLCVTVNGKKAADQYLKDRFEKDNFLDWRVGFMLVTRHGAEGQPATMYRFQPLKK